VTSATTVREGDLYEVLVKFRDLRRWALKRKMDPWVFRQGLILILELDAAAAMERGRSAEAIEAFDKTAREYALEWLKRERP